MVMTRRERERETKKREKRTLVNSGDLFAYKLAVQKISEEFKTDPRGLLILKCPRVRDTKKIFLSHVRNTQKQKFRKVIILKIWNLHKISWQINLLPIYTYYIYFQFIFVRHIFLYYAIYKLHLCKCFLLRVFFSSNDRTYVKILPR